MTSKNKKKLFSKLKKPYRLVVVNDNDLEEQGSFRLTPFNILLLLSALFVLFFLISYFILNNSGIGAFIQPNHAQSRTELEMIYDRLERIDRKNLIALKRQNDIKKVLSGKLVQLDTSNMSVDISKVKEFNEDNQPSNTQVATKPLKVEEYVTNFVDMDYGFESQLFFSPLQGEVSQGYDGSSHPAIDITPINKNASIKAVLDGAVIFTGWTYDFGHVIHLQHRNNLISVYKHNSFLHKELGDYVKAGEVIAVVGNSGELTSGVHLHLELWFNGRSLNPANFISF